MEEDNKKISAIIDDALRARGVTVDRLAQTTGIPERALALLLEEKYELLPPAPYVHGYLIKIAEALNLDGKKLWTEYLRNHEAIRRSGEKDHLPKNRFVAERISKRFVWGGLALLLILGYVVFRVISFFGEPKFVLNNFIDNMKVANAMYTLDGATNPGNQLTINGEELYALKTGEFKKEIQLQPGLNALTFTIKKPLGRDYTVTKQIFYEAPEVKTATSTENKNNNGTN